MKRLSDYLFAPLDDDTPKRNLQAKLPWSASAQAITLLLFAAVVLVASDGTATAQSAAQVGDAFRPSSCRLDTTGQIRHVVYIQFDNVHFTRDNPNVPSDLEQMPHLLNFLTSNGVVLANHHTPLI